MDAPQHLLRLVDSLYHAVVDRDERAIRSLLSRPVAMHLPREVREEALAHASLPAASLRAPINLLRFRHRMSHLVELDPMFVAVQLELPLERRDAGVVRRHAGARAAARRDDDERNA